MSVKAPSLLQNARLTFTKRRHLWHRHGIRLSIKCPVYATPVRSLLLCGSESWPLRTDVQRILVFEYSSLLSIGKIQWENFVSNSGVRRKVLGPRFLSSCEPLDPTRLFWKMGQGGQLITWGKGMKGLATGLSLTGSVTVSAWGSPDLPKWWLVTRRYDVGSISITRYLQGTGLCLFSDQRFAVGYFP